MVLRKNLLFVAWKRPRLLVAPAWRRIVEEFSVWDSCAIFERVLRTPDESSLDCVCLTDWDRDWDTGQEPHMAGAVTISYRDE